MAKQLKQILQNNPSVDYIKPPEEKKFAAKHKVLKTGSVAYVDDKDGNEDAVFKASKVKTYTRKNHGASVESSPKDSYGDGHPFDNLTASKNRVVPEETVDEVYKNKKTLIQKMRAHGQDASEYESVKNDTDINDTTKARFKHKALRHRKAADIAARMYIKKKRANEETVDEALSRVKKSVPRVRVEVNAKTKRELGPALKKYWEGSASQSVINDYKSGNVKVVKAGEKKATNEDWATEVEKTRQSAAWWRNYHAEGKALAKKKATELKGDMTHNNTAYADRIHKARLKAKNEDTEINEISNKKLGQYIGKAAADARKHAYHAGGERMSALHTSSSRSHKAADIHGKRAGKRQVGIEKAVRKITSGSYGGGFKEETINELDKKTLGSYIKKAKFELGDAAVHYGMNVASGDQDLKSLKKNLRTMKKRSKGIGQAANKLTKEDLEINEAEQSVKNYKCTACGHNKKIKTNHTGTVVDHCPKCSWKANYADSYVMPGHNHGRKFEHVKEGK